nr:unnamed protein product [Callosobruchus chinensis]
MDVVPRWRGSAHDQTVFNNSRNDDIFFLNRSINISYLGDSGYANQNFLLTPLLNPTTVSERLYN